MPAPEMTREQAKRLLWVLPFVALVAFAVSAAGLYAAFQKADLAFRGQVLWGEVVAMEEDGAPRVSFEPKSGRKTEFVDPGFATSANPELLAGDRVPVHFLPERPEDARIMVSVNWTMPLILLLVGPAFLVLAIRGIRRAGQRLAGPDDDEASAL